MLRMFFLLVAISLGLEVQAAKLIEPKIFKVQKTEISSFDIFYKELKLAIEAKNGVFIKRHLADDIKFSFAETQGSKAFLDKYYDLAKESVFWHQMQKIIDLGYGHTHSDKVCLPHLSCPGVWDKALGQKDELMQFALIVHPQPQLYQKIPPLGGELVKFSYDGSNYKFGVFVKHEVISELWSELAVSSKTKLYIENKNLWKPLDIRAKFKKSKDGKWKITSFIKGD